MNPNTMDRLKYLKSRPIDGPAFKKLVEAGLTLLKANQETVNSLNVFPVPDGDTGTNMVLTMQSAYKEIQDSGQKEIGLLTQAISQGALMGARGNSGVILSQIWRGFSRALHDIEVLDGKNMVKALEEARDTAYKGVVRPVEGTILTVMKDVAAAAKGALDDTQDPFEILERIVPAAAASVEYTPELLPVLKQAGVVDSGGKGLFYILEGMLRYVNNEPLDSALTSILPISAMNFENTSEAIEPGQDYEVVVDFIPDSELDLKKFYSGLEEMGTSIQVGEGDGMYRMHIHVPTENKYLPIDYVLNIGTVTKVAMENLVAQMEDVASSRRSEKIEVTPIEPGQIAVVAVSPGIGISRVFASLGVAALVEGGQTMNPSTQELLNAFENLPTDQVIILPNNKNIILAAEAAKEVTVKKLFIVPSKTIPQGLSAMMHLDFDGEVEKIAEKMTNALDDIISGEVTVATRSVEIDGVSVEKDQVISLLNGKLVCSAQSIEEAVMVMLAKASAEDYELITLFYGQDLSIQDANRIADLVRKEYSALEVELQDGGQPHYQFIISVE
ncbi:MAG TPA: DAK2 domain-containing protein [Anaerolineales bacterium]|nr:DAK2 domain-containing protein [Anaerolineales bacterium]